MSGQVFCYRCKEAITTRKDLRVIDMKSGLKPFHHRCYTDEASEKNTKFQRIGMDIHSPEISRWEKSLPISFFGIGIFLAISIFLFINGLIVEERILWVAVAAIIAFGFLIILGIITPRKQKKLREQSWDLYESKLPE